MNLLDEKEKGSGLKNYDDGAMDDLSKACCINGLNSKAFIASSKLH